MCNLRLRRMSPILSILSLNQCQPRSEAVVVGKKHINPASRCEKSTYVSKTNK